LAGQEVPVQRWIRARAPGHDVALVNDGKYSFAGRDGTVWLTAVRAPVFAHHDPIAVEPGARYRYMDQGEQAFTLWLAAGAPLPRQRVAMLADMLNKPLVTTPHVARGGRADPRGAWLDLRAEAACVTTLKMAEAEEVALLRAHDLDGTGGAVAIDGHAAPLPPRGLVTLALTPDGPQPRDGLERVQATRAPAE